jgi:CheY-like chemotaxis protein
MRMKPCSLRTLWLGVTHVDSGFRVLIADDERHIANLLRTNLERQGHRVTSVSNGREAIAELERDSGYTHFVLDLMMPYADGLAVLRWIRTHEETRTAWVGIMSAQADALRHEPMEYQPDLWIEKPVTHWPWF